MGNVCSSSDETFDTIKERFNIDNLYSRLDQEKPFQKLYMGNFMSINLKDALISFSSPHSFFALQSKVGMLLVHQGSELYSKEDEAGKTCEIKLILGVYFYNEYFNFFLSNYFNEGYFEILNF